MTQMRQGLAAWQAMGGNCTSRFFGPAGRGLWESRAARGGARVLAEVLADVHTNGGASTRG